MNLLETLERRRYRRTLEGYVGSLLLVALATVIGSFALNHASPTNLVMLYLLAVVVSALVWGQSAAVCSSVVGVLAFDFFMVPPQFSLTVEDAEYVITFAGLLSVALVIGTLTGRLRDRALALNLKDRETSALASFIRAMVAVQGVPAVAEAAARHVRESLDRPAALVWAEPGRGQTEVSQVNCGLASDELAVVEAFLTREGSRPSEGFFSPCPILDCIAFSTVYGFTGILATKRTNVLDPSQKHLLEAFATQAATVVEKVQLSEAAHRAEMLEEAERLHDALLNSVSHALRTPLASIIGSLSVLADRGDRSLDPSTRAELIDTAKEGAERLNLIVRDLLDMTRLQSGHLKLNLDWYDLEDVVGAALAQARQCIQQHPVRVTVPSEPLLVRLDQVLIVQVLDNLLQNACKYSEPGTPIAVEAERRGNVVEIKVIDLGPGIPPEDTERVFDKFYRAVKPGGGPPGSGLGLAICKGIVEAHGGRIWARNAAPTGTEITFTLPASAVPEGGQVDDGHGA